MKYQVFCRSCGNVHTPQEKTALWWKAKQRSDKGFLDALVCSAEECGCVETSTKCVTPYRVFGYDGMCQRFDYHCNTFVEAVKVFRKHASDIVCINGVSRSVKEKLGW